MKAVLTFLLILFLGAAALAQNKSTDAKMEILKMDLILDTGAHSPFSFKQVKTTVKGDIAHVYKFKNFRIVKELAFTTKNNRPKLA